MGEMKATTEIVKAILKEDEMARNSDGLLYLKVLQYIASKRGITLGNITVPEFLTHRKELGFVGFETVRRSRQKIQQTYPELAANREVRKRRLQKETEVRSYAKTHLERENANG